MATSVCACMSDRECSTRRSFTRTNNLYWNTFATPRPCNDSIHVTAC